MTTKSIGNLVFNSANDTLTVAKRKASTILNKIYAPIQHFEYSNDYGNYVFTRFNKVYPNGEIIFGKWK